MIVHLTFIGWSLILLALMHFGFPRYFKWKEELVRLSLINKQMMQIHTYFIGLTVFLMGLLCVTSGEELLSTDLGHKIILGFFVFWFIRMLLQFFGYSSKLWKGKKFETIMHILFSCYWLYLTGVFGYLSYLNL